MNSIMTVLVFYVRHNNFWKQFLEIVCCSQKINRKLWFAIKRTFWKQKASLSCYCQSHFSRWHGHAIVWSIIRSLVCVYNSSPLMSPPNTFQHPLTLLLSKGEKSYGGSMKIRDWHPRLPYIPELVCKCLFTWLLCPQCPPRPRPRVTMCRRTHYADLSPQSCYVTGWVNLESSGVTVTMMALSVITLRYQVTSDTLTRDSPGQVPAWHRSLTPGQRRENKTQVNGFLLS